MGDEHSQITVDSPALKLYSRRVCMNVHMVVRVCVYVYMHACVDM